MSACRACPRAPNSTVFGDMLAAAGTEHLTRDWLLGRMGGRSFSLVLLIAFACLRAPPNGCRASCRAGKRRGKELVVTNHRLRQDQRRYCLGGRQRRHYELRARLYACKQDHAPLRGAACCAMSGSSRRSPIGTSMREPTPLSRRPPGCVPSCSRRRPRSAGRRPTFSCPSPATPVVAPLAEVWEVNITQRPASK
jgi:hypothetical protein